MTRIRTLALAACLAAPAAQAQTACDADGWIEKSDAAFAADCVGMAFGDDLAARQRLAWMFFVRVNQLIEDPDGTGMSGSGQVPLWMAWPTDPDTFATREPFAFDAAPRNVMRPSAEKKELLEFGRIVSEDPDAANEEVTRNRTAYDYLIEAGLTTRRDVAAFFSDPDAAVDMPVGSMELKASWLQLPEGEDPPEGALTFEFEHGRYYWRGLHIMAKMQSLPNPADVFYSEEPSWFWATFEFNDNPGVEHVRERFITQTAPLDPSEIAALLEAGGIADFGFETYAPNGTQIRFTVDGEGAEPVILGHTDMEDFAGSPNTAQPAYWTDFEASCHACHATASYNPETGAFFPFSVPTGALDPGYNAPDANKLAHYLGQGYRPLDFMWPIAFQTR